MLPAREGRAKESHLCLQLCASLSLRDGCPGVPFWPVNRGHLLVKKLHPRR